MEENKHQYTNKLEDTNTIMPKTTEFPYLPKIKSNDPNNELSVNIINIDKIKNSKFTNLSENKNFFDHSKISEFLNYTNKLKLEKRHSWPLGLNGPRESVADHSYQLIMLVMLYHDKLDQKVDLLKSIFMAAIHDLPEAICGDIPLTDQTEQIKEAKKINEMNAMECICAALETKENLKLLELYKEYEANECYEAKFVRALDKIEAFQQHCQDPLETWIQKEKEMVFQDKFMVEFCRFDSCMLSLARKTREDCVKKLKEAGENVELLQLLNNEAEGKK